MKIKGGLIPESVAEEIIVELQVLFARHNAGAALSAKAVFKPPKEFHAARHAMSLPLVARQFLETWMPAAFLPLVDWFSLRIEKISGINASLAKRREVCEIVESTIPAEEKEKFMSAADILRQEGRQEGEQRGQILAQQRDIIKALEIRFDRVPDGLREEIEHIADSARLHVLLRAAIRCADLESFAKEL